MNHGGCRGSDGGGRNSTTIDDLDDNMLTQILFRLPYGTSVLACIPVNKRWCSIISDPKFATHFCNHKKEITTLSKSSPNINDDRPQWTFIADMIDVMRVNEPVFESPIFSMIFLPRAYVIEATFKDLVLCSGPLTRGSDPVFNIANPITKQLVALPPCRVIINELRLFGSKPWVGLVCQQPDDYTQDYKYRVVVIQQCRTPVYKLLVYCSEICEWKEFLLRVSINPELAANRRGYYNNKFQGIVCNGIIYLHHMLYFASFNPFDLDETTNSNNTTIEAEVLPELPEPVEGYLRESSGKLFIIHNPNKKHSVYYNKNGKAIEFPLKVWKLDPNQVPLIWKTTFEGLCTGNFDKIEEINSNRSNIIWNLGLHPNNDKLIYMHLLQEEQLILCDLRTKLIKPLKSLPGYNSMRFDRLELQWWPTSIPKAYVKKARL